LPDRMPILAFRLPLATNRKLRVKASVHGATPRKFVRDPINTTIEKRLREKLYERLLPEAWTVARSNLSSCALVKAALGSPRGTLGRAQ
jgi:hypothetical protein